MNPHAQQQALLQQILVGKQVALCHLAGIIAAGIYGNTDAMRLCDEMEVDVAAMALEDADRIAEYYGLTGKGEDEAILQEQG